MNIRTPKETLSTKMAKQVIENHMKESLIAPALVLHRLRSAFMVLAMVPPDFVEKLLSTEEEQWNTQGKEAFKDESPEYVAKLNENRDTMLKLIRLFLEKVRPPIDEVCKEMGFDNNNMILEEEDAASILAHDAISKGKMDFNVGETPSC